MSVYTVPALNAVNFALTVHTAPSLASPPQALQAYTVPSLSAVDFALVAYTVPTYMYVGWELLPGVGFPTQYSGLRTYYHAAVQELCLVAAADGATGMGGIPMVSKNGVTYAIYLVETADPNASLVRMEAGVGIKAIRLKT